jgi:16S rRNA C1402 N4-methylase RsmH
MSTKIKDEYILPTAEELESNPRSASVRMRAIERVAA